VRVCKRRGGNSGYRVWLKICVRWFLTGRYSVKLRLLLSCVCSSVWSFGSHFVIAGVISLRVSPKCTSHIIKRQNLLSTSAERPTSLIQHVPLLPPLFLSLLTYLCVFVCVCLNICLYNSIQLLYLSI
jgi:hypothetical protein